MCMMTCAHTNIVERTTCYRVGEHGPRRRGLQWLTGLRSRGIHGTINDFADDLENEQRLIGAEN